MEQEQLTPHWDLGFLSNHDLFLVAQSLDQAKKLLEEEQQAVRDEIYKRTTPDFDPRIHSVE